MDGVNISPVCTVPFSSPTIVPAGFKFCCLPHLPQWGSIESWNGEEIKAVRRQLLAGETPDACKACVAVNRYVGLKPDGGPWEKSLTEEVPVNFRTLSLARSNTCNNACEMCRADLSTTFGREYGGYVKVENNFDLTPFYDEIEYVYIAGGNPVQDPGVLEVLKGLKEDVVKFVMFTSNGTLFPDEYISELKRFRNVSICFSIDADWQLNEIIRKYSKHERTYKTIHELLQHQNPSFRIQIQQTLTKQTVRRMYPLYQELRDNLPIERIDYSPNPCVWPDHLSLERLDSKDLIFIENQMRLFENEHGPFAHSMLTMLKRLRALITKEV